ncbi:electron transport complex protein [Escherichia coli]|nr:electron transport complex protein [Escherichia coli]
MSEIKDVIVQGLWKNNSALVQLLGLCPLLAVTSTATNALGLGLATTLVLTLTNLTISTLRHWTPAEIRIPIYVMIIASVVSAVQMLINAYAFGLYQSLGIFIPLIVTNCIVVGRAEAFAAKKRSGAFGTGRLFNWYGRNLRHVRAGFTTRNYRQWHIV